MSLAFCLIIITNIKNMHSAKISLIVKKVLILLTLTTLLFSCGEEKKVGDKVEKQDFFVETKKINSFSWTYEIKKTWKIQSSQDIVLSSKASWRIKDINVSFWDKVHIWKSLISMSDNVANYWLNLEKTNLSVESSRLNYESTKINLDKAVNDNKINLEKLEKDYEILKKTLEQNTKSSEINLEQSKTSSWLTTTSSIQIEKLNNTIQKSEFDLENLKKSNLEQITSYETTSKNDFLNLKNLFTEIIDFSDKMLWVTKLNKDKNDSFEDYLWVKNSISKKQTEKELLELIKFRKEKFDNLENIDFEINNLESVFILWEEGYPKVISFLDNLEKVLDYSIENIYFSQTTIDTYKTKINWYKSSLALKYNWFLTFKSNVEKFLNTYKDSEKSSLKQIELLKKDLELTKQNLKISWENAKINYNKTILSNQNSLNAMEIAIKNAKLNLENSIKNREVTLKQLTNQIQLSKNTKNIAYKEYSKLFIKSPISGVISDILIDKWEDVNSGTPLIKISSLWENEIEISLSFKEIKLVNIWDKVNINYLWEKLEWSISSISPVADKNLNYKIRIVVDSKINISWNIAPVTIPIKLDKNLIPLKNIKVKSDKVWEINILSDNKIKKVLISFWEFYWESVEITWCIDLEKEECNNSKIITNDISKFDENKFNIIEK